MSPGGIRGERYRADLLKLAGGKPPTEEAATVSVLPVVWALPVAPERVVTAVLFDVAPRATTAKAVVMLFASVVVAIWKVEVVLSESEPLVNDPASPLRVSETELPDGTTQVGKTSEAVDVARLLHTSC